MTDTPLFRNAPPERGIFCNRTLNLRSIKAVGYDMDYTLIHYHVAQWEERAFGHSKQRLELLGWPLESVIFDATLVTRGLIIDVELGNVVKANRFGYVKKAYHGTRAMDLDEQRRVYAHTQIDLGDPRYLFLNTLFSISEACMYMQLVDLLDMHRLPGVLGYQALYAAVRKSLDSAHMEGELKAEIVANPDRFVAVDPDVALALLDQRESGKKLMLVTNSEWDYTREMMAYAFNRFMPKGQTWRDLFQLVVVAAAKPGFFNTRAPAYEVVENGLLKPVSGKLVPGNVYWGANALQAEASLGIAGDDILYVGDHMFTDVHASKSVLRWRTALVLRELEDEIAAIHKFMPQQVQLQALMDSKEVLEMEMSQVRLQVQRLTAGYGPPPNATHAVLEETLNRYRAQIAELDAQISPLARLAGEIGNARWGQLMRSGNDKSHLARQVERYADIYTSRVSNFVFGGPFLFLRSPRGSLPHDRAD